MFALDVYDPERFDLAFNRFSDSLRLRFPWLIEITDAFFGRWFQNAVPNGSAN